jgi:DNA-binding transcriptional LysR family regulator
MRTSPDIEIRQLRALLAVVEHGSLSRAAAALKLAQSTMSETIASLDRAIGTPVLVRRRGGHRLQLTAAGSALIPHARNVVRELHGAMQSVSSVAPQARARVDVMTVESLSTYLLPGILAAARKRWPNTRFGVMVAPCTTIRTAARDGECDLGLLLEELPLDEQDVLVSIARGDADPAVRLAAVRKVLDPVVLADIARSDADAGVREGASDVLVDVARGAYEGIQEAESMAALAGLSDPKHLMAVAKTAALETLSRAALARLDDVKAIGSVARRSTHASTRMEALGRIADDSELASIALRSDFKDVAVAAVERMTDRVEIEAVAARTKNKAAQRRARGMLRALEEPLRPPPRARRRPPVPAAPVDLARRRRLELCRQVESLAASNAWNEMSRPPSVAAWDDRGASPDREIERRFESACASVRARLARREAELAESQRVEAQIAEALAARESICVQVEALDGDEAEPRLQEAR